MGELRSMDKNKNNLPWYMALFSEDRIEEKIEELKQKAKEQGMTIDEYFEYLAELGSEVKDE